MFRFIKYSISIFIVLTILVFTLLRIPSIQDSIIDFAIAQQLNAESPLTKEDALSAIVCGRKQLRLRHLLLLRETQHLTVGQWQNL